MSSTPENAIPSRGWNAYALALMIMKRRICYRMFLVIQPPQQARQQRPGSPPASASPVYMRHVTSSADCGCFLLMSLRLCQKGGLPLSLTELRPHRLLKRSTLDTVPCTLKDWSHFIPALELCPPSEEIGVGKDFRVPKGWSTMKAL